MTMNNQQGRTEQPAGDSFWSLERMRQPRELVSLFWLLSVLLAPLLAYALPIDALSRSPSLAAFADFMAGLVPAIAHLTAVSKIPQVTELFLALQWAVMVPIYLYLFIKYYRPTPASIKLVAELYRRRRYVAWINIPVSVLACWFAVFLPFGFRLPSDPRANLFESAVGLMSESRLWLGIFGSFESVLAIVAAVYFIRSFSILRLVRAYWAATSQSHRRQP
jgi:hypothetical protein